MIIMSPLDAAAAVFGYVQHHKDGPKDLQPPSNENICFNKVESNTEGSSATVLLLKKLYNFVGNVMHEFGLDEAFFVQPIADITVTARIITEMLTSFISPSFHHLPNCKLFLIL